MSLIVCSDLHLTSKEPFYKSKKLFINWFVEQDYNNKDNVLLFLGDIFDKCPPDPITNELVIDFFNKLKFKEIIVLSGNHDYSGIIKQNALIILDKYNTVNVVYQAENKLIEGLDCLLLPFYYDNTYNLPKMYDYYSNLPKDKFKREYDYIFTHIEDESINFGNKKGIDLSYIKGKRVQGHIHKNMIGYLNTPLVNRYDERNNKGYILEIEKDKKEKIYTVPQFLDYYDIEYPNDLIFDIDIPVFTISNVEDVDNVKNYYISKYKDKQLYFRNFVKNKQDIKDNENSYDIDNLSIETIFNEFIIEKQLNDYVVDKCRNNLK